jgi:hypothetical protein
VGEGEVTWSLKKQHIIALSSTEAEYTAQTHPEKEAAWSLTFIGEFREDFGSLPNQGVMTLAKENKFHARTKYIDIRYHFIQKAVEAKLKMQRSC